MRSEFLLCLLAFTSLRIPWVLGRQPFDVDTYNGTPSYTGPARGPGKTELG